MPATANAPEWLSGIDARLHARHGRCTMTTLYWLTGLIFAALLPWGTNVPVKKRGVLVKLILILNVVFHLVTASFIYEASYSPWASQESRAQIEKSSARYGDYLDVVALTPSRLREEGGWRWGQLVTANLVHAGWLHLAMNLWLFAIYAPNIEDLFGRKRFALFILAAMVGTQLAIIQLTEWTDAYRQPHRGLSGVVYAVIGAYLVCFPRSRIKIALVYDFRFWAIIAFLLMPIIYVLGMRSSPLAELIMLVGIVAAFLLLHPDHARFGVPAFALLGYKLLQDALTMSHQAENRISIWGHAGGLVVGVAAGFLVNGTKGLRQTWPDPDAVPSPRRDERQKVSLAKMERAAQSDEATARAYLGQRIFVGDAARATDFYVHTAMKKFPDVQLDARELHSLGRMLEFRGKDAPALHVYEKLLQCTPLPPGFEDSFLSAAKLCHRTAPERAADALRYLKQYEEIAPMLRDRFEARRLREEILAAARNRGEDADALLGAADAGASVSGSAAQSYGGPGQPERRKTARTSARMQQIESSHKYPVLVDETPGPEPAPQQANDPNDDTPPDTAEQGPWGKKRLPLKTPATASLRRPIREDPSGIAPEHSFHDSSDAPTVPPAVEHAAGLKRPRVELTGMDLLPQERAPEPPPPAPVTLQRLPSGDAKELDSCYGPITEPSAEPGVESKVEAGGGQVTSEDDQELSIPMLRANPDKHDGAQREGALKQGSEYAQPSFGGSAGGRDTTGRVYTEKPATPSPDSAAQSESMLGKWVVLEPDGTGPVLPADPESAERVLAILSQELCTPVTADSVSASGGVLKGPEELDSYTITSKLRHAGVKANVLRRVSPVITRDPVELLSIDLHDEDMVCNTVEQGRLRIPLSSLVLIHSASVRLSKRESAPAHSLVEIVVGPPLEKRLQLHERTFSLFNSKHNAKSLRLETMDALAVLLAEKAGPDKLVRHDGDMSYADHEVLIKRLCLSSMATG